jgi:hypothetical protein
MAQIDYNAVLADLEDQKARINNALDGAIAGIKTMLAMRSQLPHVPPAQVTPQVQPEAPPSSARPTEQRRRYAFGRDPSQPTLADLAAAALPQNGDSMSVSEIRRRIGEAGKNVRHNVVYDILTRKDKHGRFKKDGRGMFSLNLDFVSSNGHAMTETPSPSANPKPITTVDAAERVLLEAGTRLHASDIVKGLRAYGKTTTTVQSVAGSLFQDSKRRFKNLGQNTWDLVARIEEK